VEVEKEVVAVVEEVLWEHLEALEALTQLRTQFPKQQMSEQWKLYCKHFLVTVLAQITLLKK